MSSVRGGGSKMTDDLGFNYFCLHGFHLSKVSGFAFLELFVPTGNPLSNLRDGDVEGREAALS